jgi:hypothetical protein
MSLPRKALIHILNSLVLLSGMGLFVDRMDCNRTGNAYVAVNTNLRECSDDCIGATDNLTDDCCERNIKFYKEDVLRNDDHIPVAVFADLLSIIPATTCFISDVRTACLGVVRAKAPPLPWAIHIIYCSLLI